MYKRIVIDLEANNLLEPMLDFTQRPLKLKDTAKLWCVSVRCIDTDKSFLMVPEELLEEHKEALSSVTAVPLSRENLAKMVHNHVEEVIGHNIIKYDLPVLQLFGVIDYAISYPDGATTLFGKKVLIMDTLLLSKLSNADRLGGHSLKNFGKQGSNQKIEFHDFSKFSPEMAIYCDMDTIVGKDTYFYLMKEMGGSWWEAPYLMEAKLADLTLQQELFGFHYDAELSRRNKKELDELLEERYNKVSPNIPPRPLNKTESKRFTPPAIKTIGNLSYNSKVESLLQAIGATYKEPLFIYKGKEYPLSYLKGIEKYIPPAKVHTKSGSLTAAAKKFLASIGSEYNPINDSFEFEGREYPMTFQGCVLETIPEPDVVLSSHMLAFLERIGASYDPATHKYTFEGREYSLDYEECVKETLEADIKDLAHIKWYLTELGWEPSQWNMRDLTRDIHKKVLPRDKFEETVRRYASSTMESPFKALRLKLLDLPQSTTEEQLYNFLINKDTKMLKVPTTPPLRVGATKELCPNLSKLAEDSHIEFIKDLVEFYTYQHRRNSIGGGLDEEGEESKGFESYVRADGRISTPVDTLGTSTSRMGHKVVANIPRISSLYGEKMRALFCASPPGKEGHHIQYGFDFASLEAMIEGHYVLQYPGGEEMLSALLAEKPNSIHCQMAKKLQIDRSSAKAISYGLLYGASVKKISEMLKIPMKKAEKIYNDYWEAVPALTAFKEAAEREWELSGRKTVVAGDGRKLRVRSKHSILNVLLQSLGSLCMKQTYVFLMQKLEAEGHLVNMFKDDAESIKNKVASMIIYHDEVQLAIPRKWYTPVFFDTEEEAKAYKEETKLPTGVKYSDKLGKYYLDGPNHLTDLIIESIRDVEKAFSLRVHLAIEFSCGHNWAACH